jgi:hypothetical protein
MTRVRIAIVSGITLSVIASIMLSNVEAQGGWQAAVVDLQNQINNIVSGVTVVGNADRLDGMDSTEFATQGQISDLQTQINNLDTGILEIQSVESCCMITVEGGNTHTVTTDAFTPSAASTALIWITAEVHRPVNIGTLVSVTLSKSGTATLPADTAHFEEIHPLVTGTISSHFVVIGATPDDAKTFTSTITGPTDSPIRIESHKILVMWLSE